MAITPPTLPAYDTTLLATQQALDQVRASVRDIQSCIDATRQAVERSRVFLQDLNEKLATSGMRPIR
jgi:hypothetical protein